MTIAVVIVPTVDASTSTLSPPKKLMMSLTGPWLSPTATKLRNSSATATVGSTVGKKTSVRTRVEPLRRTKT